MTERFASLAVVLVLTASCGTTSDSQRIDDLEARIVALEEAQLANASPGLRGNDSARQLQSTGEVPRTTEDTSVSPDPFGEFEEIVFEAFSESVFLGSPLDPEFGGLTIAGDTRAMNLTFVGAGLDDLNLLLAMLTSFGANQGELEELERVETEGSLTTDSPSIQVSWAWANPDRLDVVLTN